MPGSLAIVGTSVFDLDELGGITSVGGDLQIVDNEALNHLNGLSSITSIDGSLMIVGNDHITNLDGLGAITSIGGSLGSLSIFNNHSLPGCEVCELLDQLDSAPETIEVENNLDDSCTPVPANCP